MSLCFPKKYVVINTIMFIGQFVGVHFRLVMVVSKILLIIKYKYLRDVHCHTVLIIQNSIQYVSVVVDSIECKIYIQSASKI